MTEVSTALEAYNLARPFRVIIAGTRTFDDYALLCATCDHALANKSRVQIISGANVRWEDSKVQHSADLLGVVYALEKGYSITPFPADWNKRGKAAGPIRNRQMAQHADALIAFHDGQSTGTASMIAEAKKAGLKVRVVEY